jgi:hypothetical protein
LSPEKEIVMTASHLVTHRGARLVERSELDAALAPPATRTWFPLKHSQVLDRVSDTLTQAGFAIRSLRLALSADNTRFFGTLDLDAPLVSGVALCVGVRNSCDKSFPIGFCAGHRVFICDNLAFRSEIVVARKHTRNGETRFAEAIARAVGSLHQFRVAEAERLRRFQTTDLTDERASHLMLRAFEQHIVSHLALPKVIKEWREPSLEEFVPRTAWSLLNAFTAALGQRHRTNPQHHAALTIRLQDLLSRELHLADPSSPPGHDVPSEAA